MKRGSENLDGEPPSTTKRKRNPAYEIEKAKSFEVLNEIFGNQRSIPDGPSIQPEVEEEEAPIENNNISKTELPSTAKEEEEEEEEIHNLDLDLAKVPSMSAEKMQTLLDRFTPEQMRRYECYRRSGFQRSTMRKLLQSVTGVVVSIQIVIVISGIAKIFVGELIETSRLVMEELGDVGPIRPSHIREAYRRLKSEGKVPVQNKPSLFY